MKYFRRMIKHCHDKNVWTQGHFPEPLQSGTVCEYNDSWCSIVRQSYYNLLIPRKLDIVTSRNVTKRSHETVETDRSVFTPQSPCRLQNFQSTSREKSAELTRWNNVNSWRFINDTLYKYTCVRALYYILSSFREGCADLCVLIPYCKTCVFDNTRSAAV